MNALAARPLRSFERLSAIVLMMIAALSPPPAAGDPVAGPSTLPLTSTRTVEFDTDEGTWISLDVTPDGKSIVFELLGDLYRLPLAGGEAEQLTRGLPFDAQPRVSPDGRWIAFISDRDGDNQVWIMSSDGREFRQLSHGPSRQPISPAWMPDSRFVIAASDAGKITLHDIDGGSGLELDTKIDDPISIRGSGKSMPTGPTMSPDGRFLYFAYPSGFNDSFGGNTLPVWQLHRRDMRTGETAMVLRRLWGAFRPLVSPDGRYLVYGARHETQTGLRIRDLTTLADDWLIFPIQKDNAEAPPTKPMRDVLPGYAFTPDSQSVIVTQGGKLHSVSLATHAVSLIPFHAKVSLVLGPDLTAPYRLDQGPVRTAIIQNPSLSPDSKRLAFSAMTKIYTQPVAGGKPQRLTSGTEWEFQPLWSPDGQWIVYITWSMQGGHVWKQRSDGNGRPVRLTSTAGFYTDLSFSPDGRRLVGLMSSTDDRHEQSAYELGPSMNPLQLIELPLAGGPMRWIAPSFGLRWPHFAKDPARINPLDSLRNTTAIRYVMKNGELYRGDTLEQLWPATRQAPPIWREAPPKPFTTDTK